MIKNLFKSSETSKESAQPNRDNLSSQYDVVLHVGAPKAGTSAIQAMCIKNRALLAEFGFYYPEHNLDINEISGGHSLVGGPLTNNDLASAEKSFQKLLQEAKKQQRCLLLSAESFYGQHKALSEFSEGLKVAVIGYFRDPIDSLISNFNQGIKRHFRQQPLSVVARRHLGRSNPGLTGQLIDSWVDVFGEENVYFYPFAREAFPNKSIEFAFLGSLGINADFWSLFASSPRDVNGSYTSTVLEVKRLFNLVLPESDAELARELDWAMQAYADKHPEKRLSSKQVLGEELYLQLYERFSETNAAVVRHLRGDIPASFLALDETALFVKASAPLFRDMLAVVDALEAQKPALVEKLRHYFSEAKVESHPDWMSLAYLLGVAFEIDDFTKVKLNEKELSLVTQQTPGKPLELLHVISALMERSGNYQQALKIAQTALSIRPKSVPWKKTLSRLEKLLGKSS